MRHETVRGAYAPIRSLDAQARLDALSSFNHWRATLADLKLRGVAPVTVAQLAWPTHATDPIAWERGDEDAE